MCQLQELWSMKQENAYQWGKVQMKKDVDSVYFIPYITEFS
jgi:hypothetical protein